jgi:site-specific DNA recombinase
MFKRLWDDRLGRAEEYVRALRGRLKAVERKSDTMLEVLANMTEIKAAPVYEKKISQLEQEKLLIREQIAKCAQPVSSYEDTLRTALAFLASPWNLWAMEGLERRRAVLKLTFARKLRYMRGEGFRTANLTLPFNVLGDLTGRKSEMAHRAGFELFRRSSHTFINAC